MRCTKYSVRKACRSMPPPFQNPSYAPGYCNHIVSVCLFANFWENYELERVTDRLQIIQGTKITRGFC